MGDDGAQGGVVQLEQEMSRHEVPHSETTSGDHDGDPGSGRDAEGVDGELVLVNVSLLLKDVVQVPDLDAAVDGGGDDLVVGAHHQRLYIHDSLKMCSHPLDEVPRLHVPNQQLLADPSDGQLVALGQDDVAGGVELLGDVPHPIGQHQPLDPLLGDVPQLEPIEDGGAAPLLVLGQLQHQNVLLVLLELSGPGPGPLLDGVHHHGVAVRGVAEEGHCLLLIEGDHAVTLQSSHRFVLLECLQHHPGVGKVSSPADHGVAVQRLQHLDVVDLAVSAEVICLLDLSTKVQNAPGSLPVDYDVCV